MHTHQLTIPIWITYAKNNKCYDVENASFRFYEMVTSYFLFWPYLFLFYSSVKRVEVII